MPARALFWRYLRGGRRGSFCLGRDHGVKAARRVKVFVQLGVGRELQQVPSGRRLGDELPDFVGGPQQRHERAHGAALYLHRLPHERGRLPRGGGGGSRSRSRGSLGTVSLFVARCHALGSRSARLIFAAHGYSQLLDSARIAQCYGGEPQRVAARCFSWLLAAKMW